MNFISDPYVASVGNFIDFPTTEIHAVFQIQTLNVKGKHASPNIIVNIPNYNIFININI